MGIFCTYFCENGEKRILADRICGDRISYDFLITLPDLNFFKIFLN